MKKTLLILCPIIVMALILGGCVKQPEKPISPDTDTTQPDTKAPDTKKPDTKASDTKKPDTKAPDTKKPDTKAPELNIDKDDLEKLKSKIESMDLEDIDPLAQ